MRLFLAAAALLVLPITAEEATHPRLLVPASREAEIKQRIQTDPLARSLHARLIQRAEKALTERTCEYRIPDGKRLLSESRHALHQILHCGMAWRTTGDPRFRDRTIKELDAACALKDWNPSHFLDTAEMSTAVAIGLDWLHPTLTPEQITRYQTALTKALDSLEKHHSKTKWWLAPTNNWTQVCATGMAFAAEMTRSANPDRSDRIHQHALKLIDQSLKFYQPDGGYPEGAAYWHYGTNYHVILLAQQNLTKLPAPLARTGEFMMHMTGPTRLSFNFADGGVRTETPSAAQSWLATTSRDPGQARYVRRLLETALASPLPGGTTSDNRFNPLHLLWLPAQPPADTPPAKTRTIFQGEQPLAFFRTGWEKNDTYLAIKGGTGASNHGQLDAGTFIYDSHGIRWFHDLGADNYNLPGYFGKQRWDYFRLTNRSHSTLVIGEKLQSGTFPGASIVPSPNGCKIDLTPVYPKQATTITRTLHFHPTTGEVTLTDNLDSPTDTIRWAAITKATPTFKGKTLILREAGKTLTLTRPQNAPGGDWQEFSLKPPTSAENPNTGYRLIGFTVPAQPTIEIKVTWLPPTTP